MSSGRGGVLPAGRIFPVAIQTPGVCQTPRPTRRITLNGPGAAAAVGYADGSEAAGTLEATAVSGKNGSVAARKATVGFPGGVLFSATAPPSQGPLPWNARGRPLYGILHE